MFPEISAVTLSAVIPCALRAGIFADIVTEGSEFSPASLRVPDNFPLMSILDEAARVSSAISENLKLKSSGDFPDIDAVPAPVIVPCLLCALRSERIILSPFLLTLALAPVKVIPAAASDFAAMFTLIFSSFDKSPSRAVVTSSPSAVTMFIACNFSDCARSLTEGLFTSPAILSPALMLPLRL